MSNYLLLRGDVDCTACFVLIICFGLSLVVGVCLDEICWFWVGCGCFACSFTVAVDFVFGCLLDVGLGFIVTAGLLCWS